MSNIPKNDRSDDPILTDQEIIDFVGNLNPGPIDVIKKVVKYEASILPKTLPGGIFQQVIVQSR